MLDKRRGFWCFWIFEKIFEEWLSNMGLGVHLKDVRMHTLRESLCVRSRANEVLQNRGVKVCWNVAAKNGAFIDLVCKRDNVSIFVMSAETHGGYDACVREMRRVATATKRKYQDERVIGIVHVQDPLAQLEKPKGLYYSRGNRIAIELVHFFGEEN